MYVSIIEHHGHKIAKPTIDIVTKSQTLAENRWYFLTLTDRLPMHALFAVLLITNPLSYVTIVAYNYTIVSAPFLDSPGLCCPPAGAVSPESRTTHTSPHSMEVMGSLSSMVDS